MLDLEEDFIHFAYKLSFTETEDYFKSKRMFGNISN